MHDLCSSKMRHNFIIILDGSIDFYAVEVLEKGHGGSDGMRIMR